MDQSKSRKKQNNRKLLLQTRPSQSASSTCRRSTRVVIFVATRIAMTSRSLSQAAAVTSSPDITQRPAAFVPTSQRPKIAAERSFVAKPASWSKFDSLFDRRSSSLSSASAPSLSSTSRSSSGASLGEIEGIDEHDLFVIFDDLKGDDLFKLPEEEVLAVLGGGDVDGVIRKSLAAQLEVHPQKSHPHRPTVVGHRGSVFLELENTLRSFQTSHEVGCDAVELDVFLLKCGDLVVFHGGGTDEKPGCLRDYMGLEGSILDYTADEARGLAFNPHFEEFGCGPDRVLEKHDSGLAYIPTLREVLVALKDTTDLDVKIELKGPGTADPALALVEELDMVDRCHFSSFDHSRIRRIRDLRPDLNPDGTHRYRTGALFSDNVPGNFVNLALEAGASEVHLKYDTCTSSRIRAIHEAGMESMAWFRGPVGMREDVRDKYHDVGNEEETMYRTVMASGVRSMCVNRPDVLVGMIGRQRAVEGGSNSVEVDLMAGVDGANFAMSA